ncbi:glycosyltransferase family 41 protein [Bradyrhizobium sp. BR13661]|jgi:protein O-GlcNAc transferase|nr:glycosyltransferase family 41 protein [Bradyrhizobium sp. BR13661]MDH6258165.1 protein O-GlcNAc transferase [Bradyrhizobium sp. BR13661]
MVDSSHMLQRAMSLHQSGNLVDAGRLYRQVIRKSPGNIHALHYLGAIEAAAGNIERAKSLMARSLSTSPPNLMFVENYATLLCQAGDFENAILVCRKGLQLNKTSAILLLNSGMALFKTGQLPDALRQFDELLLLHKEHLGALNERGSVLASMKQHEAALESFGRALMVDPGFVDAHINSGTVYWNLQRYEEALACYSKAASLNPGAAIAWLGCGSVASAFKRYDEALAAYDKAIAIDPSLSEAWLARGNLFFSLTRYDEATAAYERALSLNARLATAWLGKGNVLYTLRFYDDALAAYDKARVLQPDLADAWFGCGNVLEGLKRYSEALSAYERAISIEPDRPGWESSRIRMKMQLCLWRDLDDDFDRLISLSRAGKLVSHPLEFLSVPSSSEDQLHCARQWIEKRYPASNTPLWRGERYCHERIRLAYVSADFKPHPVAFVMAGMFEQHDKSRFEITGISLGSGGDWDIRRRLERSFEHFIDAGEQSDQQIAELIKEREIDILVDLNGLTGGARPGIFARRCAPIQINYIGYPGTSAAEYMDYIMADRIVIPEDQRPCYAEKVAYLPHSYLVNDATLAISDLAVTRAEFGLPSHGVVFCCFNNAYKITPGVFDSWMRILDRVEGSVLWLSNDNPEATRNLQSEAVARRINAERLVFAERMPLLADHLARHRLADIFLDTLPYNAHVTACHALWAGVPVLTCLGETFAGRVAASLLQAIDLPELVTTTPQAYEALAIELAQQPARLKEIKRKLASNRLTTPLFDTRLATAHVEALLLKMYQRHSAGLPPDHISV